MTPELEHSKMVSLGALAIAKTATCWITIVHVLVGDAKEYLLCQSFTAHSPCDTDETCVVQKGTPTCRYK